MPTRTVVFEGKFSPEQVKGYAHLPFEVPPQTVRVGIEYSYSARIDSDPLLGGGNTIDLGVFDARGIDFLSAGFRGWSGSERLAVSIGETQATPGYLAGPLPPGTWHVLLGLYKIAPGGCDYRVEVTCDAGPERATQAAMPVAPQTLPASQIALRAGGWLRGEMHCHTLHSDGDTTVPELVRMARERGLDFLAITDHNSISHQHELAACADPGLILIRGVEVTTFKGHFNVWGIPDWIDFRVTRPEHMRAAIQYASARGALTSCNHPKPFGPMWDYADVEDYDCIEVWNGPWYVNNRSSLDFWTGRLAQGKRIVAVGGSDWHNQTELQEEPPRAPGTPTLWVQLSETPTAGAILQAIRSGHVVLSDAPDGPFLELRAGPDLTAQGGDLLRWDPGAVLPVQVHCLGAAGHTLTLHDRNGVLYSEIISEPDQCVDMKLQTLHSLFVRAELVSGDGDMKAMTNPIYFEPARERTRQAQI